MSPERPSAYEQLSLEAAARVDAVCDGFEKAWKAARAGAAAPRVSTYLDGCAGPERTVLAGELLALDRDCRERYGLAARLEHPEEPGAAAEATATSATRPLRRRSELPTGWQGDWSGVHGLELVDFLGSGGMGVVFKARQVALDRDVAVKFLRDAYLSDSGRRERFLQEARAVARLRHPHLVQLYEFGEVPAACGAASQPYLVLEYVSGGSLTDLVRGSPQPPSEAARLVETLADAIHYAHQQGVIHRDLKPANVLLHEAENEGKGPAEGVHGPRSTTPRPLTADLCAKITDFGLAKFVAGSDLTHSGDVVGTPSYMAPEQAAGKSAPITPAVDVYGLGAILYEVLIGRPPFAAATVDATLDLVQQDEPVSPRRLQPTVPRDLETICLKCLRKDAGRRYASAQDLADDLRRFRAGEPVRARPVGTGERVLVWCRRNPGVAGLLTALLLVFVAGSSGVLWQWQHARGNAAEAQRHAAEAQRNAAAFRRERDTARQERARAERHLRIVRNRVDRLNGLGNDLLHRPGLYRTGQAVLEEALAIYRDLLPEEGNDPRVRREAARLFGQVAGIHHSLDQAARAAEAWGCQASLLTSLLAEEPASKALRRDLAYSHRWRGNALRDYGKAREAREAYDQAARLQEGLLRESPGEAPEQLALANTLLNTAGLLLNSAQADELEPLYRRIVELDRAAVHTAPDDPRFNAELALALGEQAMFFLGTGRGSQAEAAIREALEIQQRVLAGGRLKGYIERYVARNFVKLGRILAAAGRARDAEQPYRQAVNLLDRVVKESPDSVYNRADLASTLAGLAELLTGTGRRQEAEEIRRRVIRLYESLKPDLAENAVHRRNLVLSYLELAYLLCEVGRQTEAAEPCRKALELEEDDPAVNNELAWFLANSPEPRLRDAARAVRLAKKAVTARPESANYRNTLGVAYYRNGDDRAAVAELETAMRMQAGGNSFDWYFLAMAQRRLGDRNKARTWFDRAVQWMDRHKPHDGELCRFRAEAESMLADPSQR
jgi:serine/threonine protein kinase/Tfp pilus assembly protein PilF